MAKILVVDDEPDMIWALTNVLLAENHSVVSVNSGEEAIDKIKKVAVDLVLLDFRLPGMDGIQVLEKIKQIHPELPVIMVTGYGGIEEAVQSIKLGAAHYIPKPFENQQLIEIVNKSLQMDTLKKEGLFGKRLVEKIEPRPAAQPQPVAPKAKPGKKSGFRKSGAIAFVFAVAALLTFGYYWKTEHSGNREYQVPNSKISGLSWGGGYLWLSDWYDQTIQQFQLQDKNLISVKTYPFPGSHLTGVTWAEGILYSCDSWKKSIYRHRMDNYLSVAETYPSPGPNPSALYFDGKYLWSSDGTTQKIYQHNLDEKLTVLATYDSPGIFPVGLYHDKKDFWTASAVGMKIYKNILPERFRLEKTFILPESLEIGQQIAAFTLNEGKIWISYEGLNKIYQRDLKKLQPVQ